MANQHMKLHKQKDANEKHNKMPFETIESTRTTGYVVGHLTLESVAGATTEAQHWTPADNTANGRLAGAPVRTLPQRENGNTLYQPVPKCPADAT